MEPYSTSGRNGSGNSSFGAGTRPNGGRGATGFQNFGGGGGGYGSGGYPSPGAPPRSYNSRYGNSNGGGYQNAGAFQRRGQKYNPLAPKTDSRHMREQPTEAERKITGVLELHPNGYGFIRDPKQSFVRQYTDPFVPGGAIERLKLQEGVEIEATMRPRRGNSGPRVQQILRVGDCAVSRVPNAYLRVPSFDDLTPVPPNRRIKLERDDNGFGATSMRVMDLLTPLGFGQRALIVAPPRSGKTVLLQQICDSIAHNYSLEDVRVIVLLIDERPEEVTDFRRSVDPKVEVVSSSLDCELESHIRLAQFVIKRCKRLVEMRKNVVLLLDSITRLARAFNKWIGNTGRTMTGGIDVKAMDIPKKIFSSARCIDENDQYLFPYASENSYSHYSEKCCPPPGGSLTIVGTALVDTGSRMDELIFQEFKGTGNMELVLDRRLADRRIWPAIDVTQSGTRREELLFDELELDGANATRRMLLQNPNVDPIRAMEDLTQTLQKFPTNMDFHKKLATAR